MATNEGGRGRWREEKGEDKGRRERGKESGRGGGGRYGAGCSSCVDILVHVCAI